jgi:hypothetical protein
MVAFYREEKRKYPFMARFNQTQVRPPRKNGYHNGVIIRAVIHTGFILNLLL